MLSVLLLMTYLCAIGFCLYTSGWLLANAGRNRLAGSFVACQILVVIWCVPQLFLRLPMTREMKFLFYGISYMGITMIGPAWLLFSGLYCGKPPGVWMKYLSFGIGAADYLLFLTNDLHYLFYRKFTVSQVVYGPFFYFHMLYTYACVVLGLWIVMKEFRKKQVAFAHMAVIVLAAALPLGFNLLFISGTVQADFDLTPPAFALSSFLMLLAVFRYDFLDVRALAFPVVLESIAEGVAIYNKKGEITYCNQAASRWLGIRAGDSVKDLRKTLSGAGNEHTGREEKETGTWELVLESGERLRICQSVCRDKKGMAGAGTVLVTDVGEYYERMDQSRRLAVSQQRLAIEQERNRIAQEVHDTAGHTLTMVYSLLKLIRLRFKDMEPDQGSFREESGLKAGQGWEETDDYLEQAAQLTQEGIRSLRLAINHMRREASWELVTQGIYQLTDRVKEIPIEVELQGEDHPRYSHLSGIVYECLREAVTNCLKYAEASRMDVIVKFGEQEISLFVFDDGKGCGEIKESHGLSGIRERVVKAGGQARFFSEEGEGFQIYIRLPLEGA